MNEDHYGPTNARLSGAPLLRKFEVCCLGAFEDLTRGLYFLNTLHFFHFEDFMSSLSFFDRYRMRLLFEDLLII